MRVQTWSLVSTVRAVTSYFVCSTTYTLGQPNHPWPNLPMMYSHTHRFSANFTLSCTGVVNPQPTIVQPRGLHHILSGKKYHDSPGQSAEIRRRRKQESNCCSPAIIRGLLPLSTRQLSRQHCATDNKHGTRHTNVFRCPHASQRHTAL